MAGRKRENFGSRAAVVAAMAGSAIGLGNIWRFPYVVGEHGGAVFILVYAVATLLISMPVFIAEVTLGRMSRINAYHSMTSLRPGKKVWKVAGFLAILIPLMICSYYSVIGGWSLAYMLRAIPGGLVTESPEVVSGLFGRLSTSAWMPIVMHLLFLGISAIIVARGIKGGIEAFSKIAIPALFVMIVAMLVYSISLPGSGAGVKYLVKPDWSQLTPRTFAYAMGQSFFSLSLGMGAIVTYGSYVKKEEDLVVSSAGTAISDLLFAILAGFAVMPAVFAAGIEPGAGPGLIFQSIPYIFSTLGASYPVLSTIFSVIFFLTVVVAAMTSIISLLEVGASFLVEKFAMSRTKAVTILFIMTGGVGVLCSLSFGPLAGLTVAGMNIFDIFDWLCSNILLLIMAFMVVVFVGFILPKQAVKDEITNFGTKPANEKLFGIIYFLIKWVAPIAVLLIFITNFVL